jgi:hypothetical protein
MSFAVHRPRSPLDRYVECLWHADPRAPTAREKILPSGTLELTVNFKARERLYAAATPGARFALLEALPPEFWTARGTALGCSATNSGGQARAYGVVLSKIRLLSGTQPS